MLRSVLSRTLGRPCSRLRCRLSTLRVVPSTADRQLALPLAFLSVNPLGNGWQDWADRFAQRGYSSLLLDLDASVASAATSSHARLEALEQELLKLLRNPATSSPFPPLLFASEADSLVAETYVSSHPLSALCLVSPLPAPSAHERDPDMYPTPLTADFDYEPGFPIAVLQEGQAPTPAPQHRLLRDFANPEDPEDQDGLVRLLVGRRDQQGWQQVMDWMDDNGL
ncbi:hypothetical protein JCM8115_000687 [Rhodotorula mucilaginosa]